MFFDLTNAPETFIDVMKWVFKNFIEKLWIVFIEDILIYLKKEAKHENHLRKVLTTLMTHKLYIKL